MHYYLIIAIQGFCIYHLLKHKNDYYWIFLIVFVPLVGSIIYLLTHVYNKKDAETISKDIVSLINPTKKIKDLEKVLAFLETFQNRVNLADAYFENKDYLNAIKYYEEAIKEDSYYDFYVVNQLIASYYNSSNFEKVIFYAKKINDKPDFIGSKSQFIYGLSLDKVGQTDLAESQLRAIDKRYSNYEERLVLAKFLLDKGKTKDAKEILEDISLETKNLTATNKRKYRSTALETEKLLGTL